MSTNKKSKKVIDISITKASNEIYETIQESEKDIKSIPVETNKIINPVGKHVLEKIIDKNGEIGDLEYIEKEAVTIKSIDDKTILKIKNIASKNSVLSEEIEKSRQFFQENKEKVEKQMRELVALYSIKDQKPFFFISPSEARLAIDYIKGVRNGFIQEKEEEVKRDNYIKNFINKYLKKDEEGNYVSNNEILRYCPTTILSDFKMSQVITLNSLNLMFANMGKDDYITDAILVNPARYANIRNWGHMIMDQYTDAKSIRDRGCFGKVFSAEIYVTSKVHTGTIYTIDTVNDKVIANILYFE